MPEVIYYVNSDYVKKDSAFIHVNDIGLLRGYAVFDYLKTYFGKPFRLDDHISRLQNSAKLIGLSIPKSKEEIKSICSELLSRNNFAESNIRIVVTGGVGADSKTKGDPVLIVTCEPRIEMDKSFYTDGIKIKTVQGKREISFSKTCNYIAAIDYINEYKRLGYSEVLYVLDNNILECTSSNIYIVKDGKLMTTSHDILYGITRKVIIELCAPIMEVEERNITLDEALGADEVFITSTEREVMPVVVIDEKTIADGKVGTVTKKIWNEFKKYVNSKVWCDSPAAN